MAGIKSLRFGSTSSGTNFAISPAPSHNEGDTLVIVGFVFGSGAAAPTASGFTTVHNDYDGNFGVLVAVKEATASEPSSYTVSWSGGAAEGWGYALSLDEVMDIANAVGDSVLELVNSTAAIAVPSLAAVGDGLLMAAASVGQLLTTMTPPSGMTEEDDRQVNSSNTVSLAILDGVGNPTGAREFTRANTLSRREAGVALHLPALGGTGFTGFGIPMGIA